jgi:Methyltransferase domain
MSQPRVMEPELLDMLCAADPRAIRSRRDLKRVNAWMLQTRIMARLLLGHRGASPPRRIVDLGTGDGHFTLRVAKAVAPYWPAASITLVDRQNIVAPETLKRFRALGWEPETVSADALDYLAAASLEGAVIIANLFLHHLSMEQLARVFAIAATADMLVGCEPRRNGVALLGSRLIFLIGCNHVSRHDAVASVRAGFSGRELSQLWPDADNWHLHEDYVLPFTHAFVARRRP